MAGVGSAAAGASSPLQHMQMHSEAMDDAEAFERLRGRASGIVVGVHADGAEGEAEEGPEEGEGAEGEEEEDGEDEGTPAGPLYEYDTQDDEFDDEGLSLTCPLTGELLTDPVIATDGRTYERAAVTKWIVEHRTAPGDPEGPAVHVAQLSADLATREKLCEYMAGLMPEMGMRERLRDFWAASEGAARDSATEEAARHSADRVRDRDSGGDSPAADAATAASATQPANLAESSEEKPFVVEKGVIRATTYEDDVLAFDFSTSSA